MMKIIQNLVIITLMLVLSVFVYGSTTTILAGASGQGAAAALAQHWSQVLWGTITSQIGTETPSLSDPVFNDDGSVSQSFTTADGTMGTITTFQDGSGLINVTLPDGKTQTITQSAPIFEGLSQIIIDWKMTSSYGVSIQYRSIIDDQGTWWDMSDDVTQLDGSSVLPKGVKQTFHVLTSGGLTQVQSTQSDGSTFTMNVPLAAPEYTMPDFTGLTTGTYKSKSFNISFKLTSTPKTPAKWGAMLSSLDKKTTGEFAVYNDFSGYGQIKEAQFKGKQKVVAVMKWPRIGDSQVYLLSSQSRKARPAGAALDYLLYRWQTLTALLAPSPGI